MATRFSERLGMREPKAVQLNSMDRDLQVGLWNALKDHLLTFHAFGDEYALREAIWARFFKFPTDDIPTDRSQFWEVVKDWYFDGKRAWHDFYDFLEFIAVHDAPANKPSGEEFAKRLNDALETENAGYRFVNGEFAPITDKQELTAVSTAVDAPTTALKPVSMHIQQALVLLSDKVKPDYRNSMKESISAVESLCKMIAEMPDKCLGKALDKTAEKLDLNDLLRDGFKKIYGYTSDDHGIRHGLKDDEEPEQEDARFMLVACSAFVNMLTEKARKKGKLPTTTS